MGEWKAHISVRVALDFRREFEGFACNGTKKYLEHVIRAARMGF
jgi:hypothetical protein